MNRQQLIDQMKVSAETLHGRINRELGEQQPDWFAIHALAQALSITAHDIHRTEHQGKGG